jgi:hypothetical protein
VTLWLPISPAPSIIQAQPIHLPKRPFAPAPSEKPPTKPQPVTLAVITRSAARAKFDEEVAQKQAAQEVRDSAMHFQSAFFLLLHSLAICDATRGKASYALCRLKSNHHKVFI